MKKPIPDYGLGIFSPRMGIDSKQVKCHKNDRKRK